jgi:hypothetical protein
MLVIMEFIIISIKVFIMQFANYFEVFITYLIKHFTNHFIIKFINWGFKINFVNSIIKSEATNQFVYFNFNLIANFIIIVAN